MYIKARIQGERQREREREACRESGREARREKRGWALIGPLRTRAGNPDVGQPSGCASRYELIQELQRRQWRNQVGLLTGAP